MVNKCSAIGCKSLYTKENVKLHRFPLTNHDTLPAWIAATGRKKEWKPCKSSRLCCNHFQESEYIVGHGKGVLKSTAIPTIDYRVDNPRYQKKKNQYLSSTKSANKPNKTQQKSQENGTNVEVVQIDCDDTYVSNIYTKKDNCDLSYNYNEENYYTNNFKETKDEELLKCHNLVNLNDDEYPTPIKHEISINDIKNEICNRENQCYMFTSSFHESTEPIVLSPSNEKSLVRSTSMNVDQQAADSKFNKIMALKLKKQKSTRTKDIYALYFKSLKKKGTFKTDQNLISFNDDNSSIGPLIEAQMKQLRPYKKLYLTTKHKIQRILMKAQLKLSHYK